MSVTSRWMFSQLTSKLYVSIYISEACLMQKLGMVCSVCSLDTISWNIFHESSIRVERINLPSLTQGHGIS